MLRSGCVIGSFPSWSRPCHTISQLTAKTGGKINSTNMFLELSKLASLHLYARYQQCISTKVRSEGKKCKLSFLKRTLIFFSHKVQSLFPICGREKQGEKTRQRGGGITSFYLTTHPKIPKKKKQTENRRNRNKRDPSFPFPFIRKVLFFSGRIFGGKRREGSSEICKHSSLVSSPSSDWGGGGTDRQTKREKESRMFSSFISGQSLLCPLFCGRGFAKIVVYL